MIKWVFGILILISTVVGIFTGKIGDVSNSAMTEGISAIELCITLAGGICLWCGIMRVAKTSGLTDKLAWLMRPVISRLFPNTTAEAHGLIGMNITANLLGLGNAATPLGLAAMGELAKASTGGVATRNMVMLAVINTASLQLIPTTVATLRLMHGAATPLDILPCVLISSVVALATGVIMVYLLDKAGGKA